MRHHPINNELFISNREKLSKRLKPKSAVVVLSNDIMPTNADGSMPFKQNSDLYYLTGIDQEETALILSPDHPNPKMREILFLRETNETIAVWEGHKLTQEEGFEKSGVPHIQWKTHFESLLHGILLSCDNIYFTTNEHTRSLPAVETANDRLIKWCKEKYPLHHFERLAPLIYDLRVVKSKFETELMQHACDITEKGFRRILEATAPGVWEYELEAEYIHEFIRNCSKGFAYEPIIASGQKSCILHYVENNKQMLDGELLLMDVGAEYAGYNADMTRTIPVNGRFTKRQRAVYDAVMRVKNQATDMLRPGMTFQEYNKEIAKIMESELIGLGLLDKTDVLNQNPDHPLFRKYYMHGTSHHLGIDVHDVGSIYKPFEAGMVLTVEPGIYIREEGLGIRIEDNILITENGPQNLMRNIPIHAEEIEDLMNA